jgi:anti-sigma regulatory factor (Ser/Thr protein kinase)
MVLAFARRAGTVAIVDQGQKQTADLFSRAQAAYASARELHIAAKLMMVDRLVRSHHQRDRPSRAAGSVGRHRPGREGSGHRLQKRLPRSESGPRLARHALVEWLDDALSRDDMQRATLAVSELATNAVTHGKGGIIMQADLDLHRLHVAVIDEGAGFDYQAHPVPLAQLSERGLAIVDAITSRWGIRPGPTCVWFELDRAGSRS